MGGTALGASGRSNNGLKLDVKTGKLSLWRLFPTFTFTFTFTRQPSKTDVRIALCDLKLLGSSFTQQVGGPSHAASLLEALPGLALLQMIDGSLAMHQRKTAPQSVQHRGCHRPGSLSRAFCLTPLCQALVISPAAA